MATEGVAQRQESLEDPEYDEVCRWLARRAEGPMMHWLLRLDETHLLFDSWLDSVLTFPNTKERVCDAVARMTDLDRSGVPVAGLVEFQTRPDINMFGRMMLAGGLAWLTVKPADLPGDRFELCAVVVNLTGKGDCSRAMSLGTTRWVLVAREVNLAELDAGTVLDEVAAGKAPRELLAWIPLMKNGGDPAIIRRWSALVAADAGDAEQKSVYAYALVFAGLVDRQELGREAVEELKMPRGPIYLEWTADARREGELKGELKGKAELVLHVLGKRFGTVPADLAAGLKACTEADKFAGWIEAVMAVPSLEQFRRDTGL